MTVYPFIGDMPYRWSPGRILIQILLDALYELDDDDTAGFVVTEFFSNTQYFSGLSFGRLIR